MKKVFIASLLGVFFLVASTAALMDVPEKITLQGKKQGPVTFNHKAHQALGTCQSCHHTMAADATMPDKKCSECHTPDSKVKDMAAFHGNCVDCHKESNKAKGTKAPAKCTECHLKK